MNRGGETIPKPMIEIGGKPLIWHIMKHFSEYGVNEFVICAGYKADIIKEYFIDFYIYESDITVDLSDNSIIIHNKKTENWKVTVIDTGIDTNILERVRLVRRFLQDEFILTYGDCLSDINISGMIEYHNDSGMKCTMALVHTVGRKRFIQYGSKSLNEAERSDAWISGDCCIINKELFEDAGVGRISDQKLYDKLYGADELSLYKHNGYWTSIETYRDLTDAEKLWDIGMAPWVKRL